MDVMGASVNSALHELDENWSQINFAARIPVAKYAQIFGADVFRRYLFVRSQDIIINEASCRDLVLGKCLLNKQVLISSLLLVLF